MSKMYINIAQGDTLVKRLVTAVELEKGAVKAWLSDTEFNALHIPLTIRVNIDSVDKVAVTFEEDE